MADKKLGPKSCAYLARAKSSKLCFRAFAESSHYPGEKCWPSSDLAIRQQGNNFLRIAKSIVKWRKDMNLALHKFPLIFQMQQRFVFLSCWKINEVFMYVSFLFTLILQKSSLGWNFMLTMHKCKNWKAAARICALLNSQVHDKLAHLYI